MLLNIFILNIFLVLIFYHLFGVLKSELWTTNISLGSLSLVSSGPHRIAGLRARIFGFSVALLLFFGLYSFSFQYNISYSKIEILISLISSLVIVFLIKIVEKKLENIRTDPFKTIIPILCLIISVVYLILCILLFR